MGSKSGYLTFRNDQFDWLIRMSGLLSKREMAVLMAIVRFTFGFHRNEARLSGTYLSKACGIRATHIPETLRKLSDKGLIKIKRREEKNTNTIYFDWAKKMTTDTPEMGVLNTPEMGEGILPKQEIKTSQNGSKLTPETGDKTIEKTKQKYNTENKEDVFEGRDDECVFSQLI